MGIASYQSEGVYWAVVGKFNMLKCSYIELGSTDGDIYHINLGSMSQGAVSKKQNYGICALGTDLVPSSRWASADQSGEIVVRSGTKEITTISGFGYCL